MLTKRFAKRKLVAFSVTALAAVSIIFTGVTPANSAGGTPEPDYAYFTNLGWTPMKGSLPNLACKDNSYQNAVDNGINIGIYNASPYMFQKNGKWVGIDYEINTAVLKYIGITKVNDVILQWPEMVPSLLSKRIDVIAGDIHENPGRLEQFAFTTPVWWYAAGMAVQAKNPKKIVTWADMNKKGVKVGAIGGSFALEFLQKVTPKLNLTSFADKLTEFQGLASGKVDVLVEDLPSVAEYIQQTPKSNVKIVNPATDKRPADFADTDAMFGIRKEDCTLNGAYSRALAMLRDHGVVNKILGKYGLGDGNSMFMPAYRP